MITSRTLTLLPFVVLALWGLSAGCAQTEARIGDLPDANAAPSGPGFTAPEEDGSTSDSSSSVEVAMCIQTDCPEDRDTCQLRDGMIPHKCATDLRTDSMNCDHCGNVCPIDFSHHYISSCVDSVCKSFCQVDFQDCNNRAVDGCEVFTFNDPDNCGACSNVCPVTSSGLRGCVFGKCCLPPMTWCDFWGCVDTSTDNNNCGGCGQPCPTQPPNAGPPPPNMAYTCQQSECGHLVCQSDQTAYVWADCNHDIDPDGCEANLAVDTNNCGACGNVCAPGVPCVVRDTGPNFRAECGCQPGESLCQYGDGSYHCARLLSDVLNCGLCGRQCGPTDPYSLRTIVSCNGGFCDTECVSGTGDCDEDSRNGCETDLLTDPRHCGTCGTRCSSGQPCIDGKCLTAECDAGVVTK